MGREGEGETRRHGEWARGSVFGQVKSNKGKVERKTLDEGVRLRRSEGMGNRQQRTENRE